MDGIREKHGLSERHACRIVGQHRGTQRYVSTLPADEDALIRAIIALASEYGHGDRRLSAAHRPELDPKIVALGTSVTVAGGKIAEAAGALGLMGSALALTKSAASLELAAAKLAAGGSLPDAAKKGGRLAGLAKGALGITAIGGLAELAKQYDTLQMPEFTKDGIGRGLLGALDPNLPDMVLGKTRRRPGAPPRRATSRS